METSYHQIISAFVDKHGLSRGQVIAEIERTFSSMLSRWHKKNVMVVFADGQLVGTSYQDSGAGDLVQTPIDLATMRGWNTIKRILDKNLSTAACMDEVRAFKHRENSMVWGEIISRTENHLVVELEMEFGVNLYAKCPLKYVGPHERLLLHSGEKRAFHLRKVESVMLGDTPRTQLTVDRVSKTLVERLLAEAIPPKKEIKIQCYKRYVGKKSFVESSVYIPKKLILRTSRELDEHIQVKVVRGRKHAF